MSAESRGRAQPVPLPRSRQVVRKTSFEEAEPARFRCSSCAVEGSEGCHCFAAFVDLRSGGGRLTWEGGSETSMARALAKHKEQSALLWRYVEANTLFRVRSV